MSELIDDIANINHEPINFYRSLGFNVLKEHKERFPVGPRNVYVIVENYNKVDESKNKWTLVSKEIQNEKNQTTSIELNGKVITNRLLNPMLLSTKEKSIFHLFKPNKSLSNYVIKGIKIADDSPLKKALDMLKDYFILIKKSGTNLEFQLIIDDQDENAKKYFFQIVNQLLLTD